MKRKKPTPKQVVQAIHDMLYLDRDDGGERFYNARKEWSVDLLDEIAGVVELLIPRPDDERGKT
jgi:hypothetical protein